MIKWWHRKATCTSEPCSGTVVSFFVDPSAPLAGPLVSPCVNSQQFITYIQLNHVMTELYSMQISIPLTEILKPFHKINTDWARKKMMVRFKCVSIYFLQYGVANFFHNAWHADMSERNCKFFKNIKENITVYKETAISLKS